ncbi:MAG: hypothetical protein V3V10_01560 [Planctomycetota bacterium]
MALLFVLSPLAAQNTPLDKNILYQDECLLKLDYDGHLQNLCTFIKQNPDDANALAMLHRAMELRKQFNTDKPLYDLLKSLADEDFNSCGIYADSYVEAYSILAAEFDATLSWQAVKTRWLGVREWAYVGPFADTTAVPHADVFPPETRFDPSAKYAGVFGTVSWTGVRYTDSLADEVDFGIQKRWTGFGYYLATNLESTKDTEATLHINAAGPGKVWWRGKPLIDMDSRGRDFPVMALTVQLKKGPNLLLIKVSGVDDWSVKLRDSAGRPLETVKAVKPSSRKPQAISGGSFPSHVALPQALAPENKLGKLAASTIYRKQKMSYTSYELLDEVFASESEKASPDVYKLLEVLRTLDDSHLLSGPAKLKRSRALIDLLANLEGGRHIAAFYDAKMLAENDQAKKATEIFRRLAKELPNAFLPWLELAKLYETVDWRAEWKQALKSAERIAPLSLAVSLQWEDFYSARRDTAGEIATDRKYLKTRPASRDALLSLALNLQRVGKPDEALTFARLALKSEPGNDFALNRLAQSLILTGKVTEAMGVYEELASRTAEPEEALNEAASQCLKLGKDKMAIELFKRVLKHSPGSHVARRQLGLLTCQDYRFWQKDATKWNAVAALDIRAEDFPRADSALVVDELVQWVYADGSSISYIRQIRKILTQDGVDSRGKIRIRGELVTARTIKADGTELEPITQAGGLIEFPGVEVGCYIDVAYLLHTGPNAHGKLLGDMFFFVDQGLDEPFALSRWVIYNEGKPLEFIARNTDEYLLHTVKRSSGFERHEWSRAKPEHPEAEPYMPSPLEFIPWIEVIDEHDWHTRAREAADYGLRYSRNTSLLREKANELTAGFDDDIEKARAIFQWVNANFRTRGSSWNAHQALVDMAGDRERVFIALGAGAGINMGFAYVDRAQPYKLPDLERPARASWMYRSDNDYNDFYITVRDEKGQRVWINMEHRLAPFGAISSRLADAPALVYEDGQYTIKRIPGQDSVKDRFENHLHIKLKADGSATITGDMKFLGDRSYAAKDSLSRATEEDRNRTLAEDLGEQIPGFTATELSHPDLDTVGKPLTRKFEGKTKQIAKAVGDTLTMPLPIERYGRLLSVLVATEKRVHDLDIAFNMHQFNELRVSPPEGYSFSEIPKSLIYPTTPLEYAFEVTLDGRDLVIKRSLSLGPGRFYPSNYADLQQQINRIRKAEAVRLVMKKD